MLSFQFKGSALGLAVLSVMSLSLVISGCGSGQSPITQIVTNAQLKTFQKDSDDWVQATVTLNTGGFQVAGVNVPIYDPRNNTVVYGQLAIVPTLCSGTCANYVSELTVALNISQVSHTQGVNPVLPNGTPLPVGGLGNATVIAIPIMGKSGVADATIYFAFGPGVAMLGTAVSFSALDPAGQYVPGVNIFQPIKAGPINLIAGIYAGAAPKTTGVGFFIDLSGVINKTTPSSLHSLVASNGGASFQSKLTFKAVKPSSRKENDLYMRIYQLSQKGRVLDMLK